MSLGADNVRDALASVTGAPFQIGKPGPNRLLVRTKAKWFVISWDIGYAKKTVHLKAAWKDKEGRIWFETSKLADMAQLVESEYGQDGAELMPDPKVGVPPPQRIPHELADFPLAAQRLKMFDAVVSEVAQRNGVAMKLLYDGGAGITVVRVVATLQFDEDNPVEIRKAVEQALGALAEAYEKCLASKRRWA